MEFERRLGGLELRAEGRRLSGIVMRYGDISPSHHERFEPGSIRFAEVVHLDLAHDPLRAVAWHPGGGLALDNGRDALTMRAELPPIPAADRALAEVRAGRVDGLSVEFKAVRERRDGGLRVIEEGILLGIGIVQSPSYVEATVEARRKRGRKMRMKIPAGRNVECRCSGSGRLARYTGEMMKKELDRAFDETRLILFNENYNAPLAAAKRGSLRRTGPLELEADLPVGPAGDAVVAADESVGVVVRPFVDPATAVITQEGEVAVYESFELRALIATATDAREGWDEAVIEAARAAQPAPAVRRRRFYL